MRAAVVSVSLCLPRADRVRLAGQMHSLARFSKRTMEQRLPLRPTAGSRPDRLVVDLLCPIALSPTDFRPYCTSLCGVLFSVRSRYLFAIGLEECLVFAVDARVVHEGYPTPDTLELTHTVLVRSTGLSPCIALRSRRLRSNVLVLSVSPNTTLPPKGGLRFGLDRVHSRLLTTSRYCFLFRPILRCFSSRRSPLREAIAVGIPIRRSYVLRLRAAPIGFSQLGTSFVGSQAEPSTSWHSSHVCWNVLTRWYESSICLELCVHAVSSRPLVVARRTFDPSHPHSRGVVHIFFRDPIVFPCPT